MNTKLKHILLSRLDVLSPQYQGELSRNSTENYGHGRMIYKADTAQILYKDRRTKANMKDRLLRKYKVLYQFIDKLLKQGHNFDVIVNRIIKEETNYTISTAIIYHYIMNNLIRCKQCTFTHGYKKNDPKRQDERYVKIC